MKNQKKIFAVHRPGALGDIICLLQLSGIIQKTYGPTDFYVHPTNYGILSPFIKTNESIGSFYENGHFNSKDYPKWVEPCGYPFSEGFPSVPMKKHILEYFAAEIGIKLNKKDIHCLLSLPSYSPPVEIQSMKQPFYITIQVQTGWSRYKDWPLNNWFDLVRLIKKRTGIPIFQIGGPNDPKIHGTDGHFLGRPFLDSLSAQSWARVHIGLDSVFNHTSNIRWSHKKEPTKSIILFGSTNKEAFGYENNVNIQKNLPCQPCYRENPEISDRPGGPCPNAHQCMNEITADSVYSELLKII